MRRKYRKLGKINLLHRTELWMPTLQGWVALMICLGFLGFLTTVNLYPFLAMNAPVNAKILVVEGWLPDYALKQAATEFRQGAYQTIVTVGPPVAVGSYLTGYKTYADVAAATLELLGVPPEQIVAVPAPYADVNRTLTAAVTFKNWLTRNYPTVKAVNLFSLGPHARRSWLLLRQALDPTVKAGVIAVPSMDYDPERWWRYSAGARAVISEVIGYCYARLTTL
ncbi:MAG: YdcF family protein [Synechococcales cyanobacterium M58_A2018_015]|nr:YdcF family protein [Synechococcales cyanobacterium M58_A2018_015]